jgi:NADH-quinone oxidoreductase subunit E
MPGKKEDEKKEISAYEAEDIVLSIIENYSEEKSPLLPILQDVQKTLGLISPQAMIAISETLDIPLSRIYSAVTFYNDFKTEKQGKHIIRVCMGTACCIKKSECALLELEKELGIKTGSTTKDKMFTLETVNCFGACSIGPIVEIDGKIFSKVDRKKAKKIAEEIKKGKAKR